MKAVALDRGGFPCLVDLDEPVVGAGEIVIEVRTASVNRADLAQRAGTHGSPGPTAPARVVGLDAAGTVVAVGEGVDAFDLGDRVMAMVAGGLAERVVVPAAMAVPIPDAWTLAEGAAAIVGLMTEHNALRTAGRLARGESVLVHAGISGVGLQGIQLARHLGASQVVTTVRRRRAEELLLELGADHVLVVEDGSFADAVLDVTGGRGADVVLDHVGAAYLADDIAAMAIGGRLVGIGRLGGANATLDMEALAFKRLELIGVTFRTRTPEDKAAVVRAMRSELDAALASGALRPTIDRILPWTDVDAAHTLLRDGVPVGKVVLELY